LNKEIIQALANHAQQIAKHALNQAGAGVSLVTDVKVS
jgi:cation transport regulator ChaB